MKNYLLVILILTLSQNSFGCINEYRTDLKGEVIYTDPASGKIRLNKIDTTSIRKKTFELLQKYQHSDSMHYLSDYAANLIYLGDYLKAKKIYHEIEVSYPGLYTTASNLGTIYELIGMPDSALIWIKKAIEINPNSHGGSEWIHIKILEHKLKEDKNHSESILNLDFGIDAIPSNINEYNLDELKHDIQYQLRERLKFIQPKNKIIGNIYFDLGNIIAQTNDVQVALESYSEAELFGYNSELLKKRKSKFERLALNAAPRQFIEKHKSFIREHFALIFGSIFFVFLLSIILAVRFIRKRRKKRKGNNK